MVVAVAMLIGCGGDARHEDAGVTVDGQPDAPPVRDSFHAKFDQPCNEAEAFFCEAGLGVCYESICTRQCKAVGFPRCGDGFVEFHRTVDGSDNCLCLPQ